MNSSGFTINGGYMEHHGDTIIDWNKLILNNIGVINGMLINCKVDKTARVLYNGVRNLFSHSLDNITAINFKGPSNKFSMELLPTTLDTLPTIIHNGNQSVIEFTNTASGTMEERGIGSTAIGQTDYYGSSHSFEVVDSEFLTGTRSVKVTKTASSANGGSFRFLFPSWLKSSKLTAWAIIKVPSGQDIQCTFGMLGYSFQDSGKGQTIGGDADELDKWMLLVIDDVVPYDNYISFNINKVGGGDPTNGTFFYVDSFGVSQGGLSMDNLFKTTQKDWVNSYRRVNSAPTTGAWSVGDRYINETPTAGGNIGWICTTVGIPGTWKTFGNIGA